MPEWLVHLKHLIERSAKAALDTLGMNLIELIALTIIPAGITFTVVVKRQRRVHRPLPAMLEAVKIIWKQKRLLVWYFSILIVAFLGFNIAMTIYRDHQEITKRYRELVNESRTLKRELDTASKEKVAQSEIITMQTPGFNNLMYVGQAFRLFRSELGYEAKCQFKLTAPIETNDFALAISTVANMASNCGCFGPDSLDENPHAKKEAYDGMEPGYIIVHAPEDFRAANTLFSNLRNYVRCKRSYKMPASSSENLVWLQFGTNMKWNSQLQ